MTAIETTAVGWRALSRRFISGSVWCIAANYLRAGLSFATVLVVAAALGDTGLGRWGFALAWSGLLLLAADLGLGELLAREGARRPTLTTSLLQTAVCCRLAVVVPLGAALLAAAGALALDPETAVAVRLGVPLAAIGAVYGCSTALLRAREAFASLLWLDLAGLTAQLVGIVVLLRWGYGVAALLAVALVVQLSQLLGASGLLFHLAGPPTRVTVVRPRDAFPLLRQALPFAAAGVVATLQARANPLLIGYLRGPAEVGWFVAAWRLVELVRLVPQGVFGAALPILSREFRHDASSAPRLRASLERTTTVTALAGAATVALGAPMLVRATFGRAFEPAVPALGLLAVGLVPALANAARRVYLFAAGAAWVATGWSAAGLFVQLAASVPLVHALGPTGAASAIVLGEVVVWRPLRRATRRSPAAVRLEPRPSLPTP